MSWFDWFRHNNPQFGIIGQVSCLLDTFDPIWNFSYFCRRAQSALLQDLPKIQIPNICQLVNPILLTKSGPADISEDRRTFDANFTRACPPNVSKKLLFFIKWCGSNFEPYLFFSLSGADVSNSVRTERHDVTVTSYRDDVIKISQNPQFVITFSGKGRVKIYLVPGPGPSTGGQRLFFEKKKWGGADFFFLKKIRGRILFFSKKN